MSDQGLGTCREPNGGRELPLLRWPERCSEVIRVEIDIGIGKSGRQGYGFDDIAIVPSRRARDPDDVDISWQLDAFKFDLPMMGSAMDSAISPATAAQIGRLGGLAVLNLEGLWTRYEDPEPYFEEIAELPGTRRTPYAGDLPGAGEA